MRIIRHENKPKDEDTGQSIKSILISLVIVALAVSYSYGFKYVVNAFYKDNQVDLPQTKSTEEDVTATSATVSKYLEPDKKFSPVYLMVKNVADTGFSTSEEPGVSMDSDHKLTDGEILYAVSHGKHEKDTYYQLDDDTFIIDDSEHLVLLNSYIPMDGYVSVTYINASGIKLRSWADFDEDNISGTVYAGDQLNIHAKIITKDGVEAYITDDGQYISTDNRYFNDYTYVKQ